MKTLIVSVLAAAFLSTGIANVAAEEAVLGRICLTNEQGNFGGAPASGWASSSR